MKIFKVVTERDGETTKSPGRSDTDVIHSEYRYAADTIDQVWAAANALVCDLDETIVLIFEEHPAVTILG